MSMKTLSSVMNGNWKTKTRNKKDRYEEAASDINF